MSIETEFKKGDEVFFKDVPAGVQRITRVDISQIDDQSPDIYYTLEVVVCEGDDIIEDVEEVARQTEWDAEHG